MKRVCFLLRIKKDLVEEYKKEHQVWPEMLETMRKAGMKNYSIFLTQDGLLIGYFEAENPEKSLKQVGETKINKRWQDKTAQYFEGGSGDLNKGKPQWVEQVFYME